MNYSKHYELLIERAKNRKISGYVEKHHIVPRCLGGTDNEENLVELYPEEHFLAHQLLVKIYPNNFKLVKAATMMCTGTSSQKRVNNKMYSWLRKKLSEAMKISQSGNGNSQFGTCWVSNLETKECKKIDKFLLDEYLIEGWIKKRIIDWDNPVSKKSCPVCNKTFLSKRSTCSLSCGQLLSNRLNPKEFGKGKLESMIEDYKTGASVYRCLKNAGLDGTGKNHSKLKEILKNL